MNIVMNLDPVNSRFWCSIHGYQRMSREAYLLTDIWSLLANGSEHPWRKRIGSKAERKDHAQRMQDRRSRILANMKAQGR